MITGEIKRSSTPYYFKKVVFFFFRFLPYRNSIYKCPEIRNVNILRCKYTVPVIVSDDIGLILESLR